MRFGLGDVSTVDPNASPLPANPSGSGGTDLITQLVTGFTQFKLAQNQLSAAQQMNAINLQRQAQGLAPIAFDTSGLVGPGVSVGLSAGTTQLLTYAALGIGALMAFNIFMKHGRR